MLHKNLLAYFCFISLITIAPKTIATQQGHAHLEPIIQHYSQFFYLERILPNIRLIFTEYSDLISSLQEKNIPNDFLPYIAEYEAVKGSSIDPNIRIFFYDGLKLPLDHVDRTKNGICFMGLNFIFIEINSWFDPIFTRILNRLSLLEGYANEDINQLPIELMELGLAYKDMSDEEKNHSKEESISSVESLSDAQKAVLRSIYRRVTLFHELGHCDLYLDHEVINLSIMSPNQDEVISAIIRDPSLSDSLLSDLFFYRYTSIQKSNALYLGDPDGQLQESDMFLTWLPLLLDNLQELADLILD